MARRKKKTRRRSPKTIKLLNVAESLAYANILTTNVFNTDAWNFVTGKDNLALGSSATFQGVYDAALAGSYGAKTGADAITLKELISNPTVGMGVAAENATNNWQTAVIQTVGVQIGFKLGKKLMRKPISQLNRNVMKPLGLGISI